jgi:hypothetical protein
LANQGYGNLLPDRDINKQADFISVWALQCDDDDGKCSSTYYAKYISKISGVRSLQALFIEKPAS